MQIHEVISFEPQKQRLDEIAFLALVPIAAKFAIGLGAGYLGAKAANEVANQVTRILNAINFTPEYGNFPKGGIIRVGDGGKYFKFVGGSTFESDGTLRNQWLEVDKNGKQIAIPIKNVPQTKGQQSFNFDQEIPKQSYWPYDKSDFIDENGNRKKYDENKRAELKKRGAKVQTEAVKRAVVKQGGPAWQKATKATNMGRWIIFDNVDEIDLQKAVWKSAKYQQRLEKSTSFKALPTDKQRYSSLDMAFEDEMKKMSSLNADDYEKQSDKDKVKNIKKSYSEIRKYAKEAVISKKTGMITALNLIAPAYMMYTAVTLKALYQRQLTDGYSHSNINQEYTVKEYDNDMRQLKELLKSAFAVSLAGISLAALFGFLGSLQKKKKYGGKLVRTLLAWLPAGRIADIFVKSGYSIALIVGFIGGATTTLLSKAPWMDKLAGQMSAEFVDSSFDEPFSAINIPSWYYNFVDATVGIIFKFIELNWNDVANSIPSITWNDDPKALAPGDVNTKSVDKMNNQNDVKNNSSGSKSRQGSGNSGNKNDVNLDALFSD